MRLAGGEAGDAVVPAGPRQVPDLGRATEVAVPRRLPGPRYVKCLAMAVALAGIAAALWYGVYPLISDALPVENPSMG